MKQLLLEFIPLLDLSAKEHKPQNCRTKVVSIVIHPSNICENNTFLSLEKQWLIIQGKLKYSPWGTMHDKRHTMCHRIQQSLIYLQLDLKHLKILELNECQPYLRHSFPTILVDQFQQHLHVPDVQKKEHCCFTLEVKTSNVSSTQNG